jgi:hypothetical protein
MMRTKDLTGQMFGKWKVLYQVEDHVTPKGAHQPMWMCECQCEKHIRRAVNGYVLTRGESNSCGCLSIEITKIVNSRQNTYELINNEYYIGYTQSGKEFYFDKEDYDLVSQYCWDIDNSNGYAKTIDKINHTGKLYLHRLVMGCKKGDGIIIDHIDRNRTDCRKSNMRVVNSSQNTMNSCIRSDNISGVKGVYWNSRKNKWTARITANKLDIFLGNYDRFEDAETARKIGEEKYFGEYNIKTVNVI